MSKRGLVAYSDALRLELGDEIGVTTVYPGYIRTGIHAASKESGVGRPMRDLATTRAGTIQYFLARRSPRPLLDLLTTLRVRRPARNGSFEPTGLAGELAARLSAR